MSKINIVSLGGCLPLDILKCDTMFYEKYNIAGNYLGSISRTTIGPGKIANRLEEDMYGKDIPIRERRQINLVTKNFTPASILERQFSSDTVILVDVSYEIANFYFDGDEIFDLKKFDRNVMPAWFGETVDRGIHSYDNGSKELAMFQYHALNEFSNKLVAKNIPVIFFDNFFSKHLYNIETNSVATIISLVAGKSPFKRGFKKATGRNVVTYADELELFDYSTRVIDKFYAHFKQSIPKDFKMFSANSNSLFSDPTHHYGYHPAHLHRACREMLLEPLTNVIHQAIAEHNVRQLRSNLVASL